MRNTYAIRYWDGEGWAVYRDGYATAAAAEEGAWPLSAAGTICLVVEMETIHG
jgi:hypothetical protein